MTQAQLQAADNQRMDEYSQRMDEEMMSRVKARTEAPGSPLEYSLLASILLSTLAPADAMSVSNSAEPYDGSSQVLSNLLALSKILNFI